jgi:hypothetical protein
MQTVYSSLAFPQYTMTYQEKNLTSFLDQLAFDDDFYDVYYSDETLQELAKDFLDTYAIPFDENCDYRNGQNDEGNYYCDMASERADSQVDIYNARLRKTAPDFQYFIQEALEEFGYDQKRGIIGTFQMGQYLYYSRFAGYVLNQLETYMKA